MDQTLEISLNEKKSEIKEYKPKLDSLRRAL